MVNHLEIRCPVGPQRLFAKLLSDGERPKVVDGNLLEFACADCRRLRRQQGETVSLVLHRYNILGELIETQVVE